jgi:hypothetical protein
MKKGGITNKNLAYSLVIFTMFLIGDILTLYEKTDLLNAIITGFLITFAIFGVPDLIVMLFIKKHGVTKGVIFGGSIACLVEFLWAYLSKIIGYENWRIFVTAAIGGILFVSLYGIYVLIQEKLGNRLHIESRGQ